MSLARAPQGSAAQPYADPRFSDAGPHPRSRLLRLRSFELLIFVVMAILFAMCLCATPLVAEPRVRGEAPGLASKPNGARA